MNVLSGAVTPDSGRISIDGTAVTMSTPHQANRLGIRAVHQEFSLVPHLSIAENVLMGKMPNWRGLWVNWRAAHDRAGRILGDLGFMQLDERARVSRLSVSQQQVVEIAKALAEKPGILILDEPSAVLSKEELALLFALIRRLKADDTLVLYISHRLEEVFEIADRITVLRDGERVDTVCRGAVDQNDLIRMMVGRSVEEIYPRRSTQPGGEILSVEGLGRDGEFRDVRFSLRRGEVVGMFGLVGSGRTAVARSIFGAEPATAGRVCVDGKPVRLRSPGGRRESRHLPGDRRPQTRRAGDELLHPRQRQHGLLSKHAPVHFPRPRPAGAAGAGESAGAGRAVARKSAARCAR